ncbi:hypothetical protein PMIN07_001265 [Paraphaeosphaeria minitans]
MPPKPRSGHGFQKPANNPRPSGPTLQQLRQDEQRAITDQILIAPCVRCGDTSHACLDCSNTATYHSTGPYGSLSAGKKLGADKWIDEIKKKYAANKRDLKFAQAIKNREKQDREKVSDEQKPGDQGTEEKTREQRAQDSNASTPSQKVNERTQKPRVAQPAVATSSSHTQVLRHVPASVPASATGQASLPTRTQHIIRYPEVQRTVFERTQPPTGEPRRGETLENLLRQEYKVNRDSSMEKKLGVLDQSQLQFPKREVYAPESTSVWTNHFEIRFKKDVIFHKYTILPSFDTLSKKRIKDMMKTAIESCDFLRNNQASFATDYFDTIISWTDLHNKIQADQHKRLSGSSVNLVSSQWELVTVLEASTPRRLTIQYQGTVDIGSLFSYSNADPTHANDNLGPTLKDLNIVISKCFDEAPASGAALQSTFQTGTNKYYLKDSYRPLTDGPPRNRICNSLETSRGFEYQMKPGVAKTLLNLQTRTSASFRPKLVSEIMQDGDTVNQNDLMELDALFKGLWVRIEYERGEPSEPVIRAMLNTEQARVKQIQGLGDAVSQVRFDKENGTSITVREHLENTQHIQLQCPNLRAVNLGSPQDPKWYAPEQLRIMPFQLYKDVLPPRWTAGMIETACVRPIVNSALIEVSGMRTMGLPPTQIGHSIPIPLCPVININPSMMMIPSQTLPFPRARYGNSPKAGDQPVIPLKAHWNTRGKRLFQVNQPNQQVRVTLLTDPRIPQADNAITTRSFKTFSDFAGPANGNFNNYQLANVRRQNTKQITPTMSRANIRTAMDQCKGNTDLFLLILRDKDYDAYSHFKDLADCEFGIGSICITAPKMKSSIGEKMGNIMLKMNLKLGGINHTIEGGLVQGTFADTLVLGADVTHPGPTSIPGCPSVAAFVGSVDAHAGRFLGSMRLQHRSKKEMIDEVESMVKERIVDWVMEQRNSKTKKGQALLPKHILYYRDGVSDDQFSQVKNQELPEIRKAFWAAVKELKANKVIRDDEDPKLPKLTAIICIKRHSVRFYPLEKDQDNTGNCKPGTLVDSVITSPYSMDFYLQSHAAIQGTAKPAHYFVIENEMGMSEANIRQLTHELCYTYVRATSGVSYASPAYYADRLCERGRCYLRDFFVRTNDGRPYRQELERDQRTLKNAQHASIVARYGPERNPATRKKRARHPKEEEQRRVDKDVNARATNDWVWERAAVKFYGGRWVDGRPCPGPARNPFHDNVRKTMFWM